MEEPKFPQEFVQKHCGKVCDSRDWRKHFDLPPDPEDDEANAECNFVGAGASGLQCQHCDTFLCPTPPTNPADAFVPVIRKYYKDMDAYQAYLQTDKHKEERRRKEKEDAIQRSLGAHI